MSDQNNSCLKCGHDKNDPNRRGVDSLAGLFCIPGCGCECTFKDHNKELEEEFKAALKEWLAENPEETNIRMARYFFFAGGGVGTQLARKLYAKAFDTPTEIQS